MNKKFTLNTLIGMMFFFALVIPAAAQQGENSWTYSEGWWEVYSVNESDSVPPDSKILFPENEGDGRLRLYNRATTELNAEANVHGVTLTVRILDAQTKVVLAENSQYGFYTNENTHLTVTTNYDIDPGEGEMPPIQTERVQITHCPGETGGGGEPTGWFGASFLRYDYDHIDPFGKKWFLHFGNHCSGNCTNCPTTCGNVSYMKEYYPVRCIGHNCDVGTRVAITIPWGPLGCSAIGGLGTNHASWIVSCFDRGYN